MSHREAEYGSGEFHKSTKVSRPVFQLQRGFCHYSLVLCLGSGSFQSCIGGDCQVSLGQSIQASGRAGRPGRSGAARSSIDTSWQRVSRTWQSVRQNGSRWGRRKLHDLSAACRAGVFLPNSITLVEHALFAVTEGPCFSHYRRRSFFVHYLFSSNRVDWLFKHLVLETPSAECGAPLRGSIVAVDRQHHGASHSGGQPRPVLP